jgi:predicted nucleic acid-binding protein
MAIKWLLDVNVTLASRWVTHPVHAATAEWIDSLDQFFTTAITELAFIRVSLSPGYGASWEQAQEALISLQKRTAYRFLDDDVHGAIPRKSSYRHTTDAHLAALAERHGLLLATFDRELLSASWALNVAFNPLE